MPSHYQLKRHEGAYEKRQGPSDTTTSTTETSTQSSTTTTTPTTTTPTTTTTSTSSSSSPTTSNTPATSPTRTPNTRETEDPVSRTRTTVTKSVSSPTISAPSNTNEADTGMGMGSIVGIGVAGVVAVACVAAFVIWLLRRRRKQKEDAALDALDTPFDRSSFMRHSAVIPDDPHGAPFAPGANGTRSPQMAEKGYGTAAAIPYTASTYPQDNYNYGLPAGGLAPGGYYNNNAAPAPAPNYGPGGAPISEMPGLPQTFATPNPFDQYATLSRDTPEYHMAPYNPHGRDSGEFTTSAGPAHKGHVVEVKDSMHDGNSAQYGFAPPEQTTRAHGQAHGNKKRPDTVYDEDDAYGGM